MLRPQRLDVLNRPRGPVGPSHQARVKVHGRQNKRSHNQDRSVLIDVGRAEGLERRGGAGRLVALDRLPRQLPRVANRPGRRSVLSAQEGDPLKPGAQVAIVAQDDRRSKDRVLVQARVGAGEQHVQEMLGAVKERIPAHLRRLPRPGDGGLQAGQHLDAHLVLVEVAFDPKGGHVHRARDESTAPLLRRLLALRRAVAAHPAQLTLAVRQFVAALAVLEAGHACSQRHPITNCAQKLQSRAQKERSFFFIYESTPTPPTALVFRALTPPGPSPPASRGWWCSANLHGSVELSGPGVVPMGGLDPDAASKPRLPLTHLRRATGPRRFRGLAPGAATLHATAIAPPPLPTALGARVPLYSAFGSWKRLVASASRRSCGARPALVVNGSLAPLTGTRTGAHGASACAPNGLNCDPWPSKTLQEQHRPNISPLPSPPSPRSPPSGARAP